ncbi:MAG: hypothetical protein RL120_03755, partial [Gammaproteobacteria bacterium]
MKTFTRALAFVSHMTPRRWLVCLLLSGASIAQGAEIVLYDPGTLAFSTSDQSMWETGAGIVPQEVTYSTSWSADANTVSLGEITGVESFHVPGTGGSIPNPLRAAYDLSLQACKNIGFTESQCKNGSGAIYTPCVVPDLINGGCLVGNDKISDGISGLGSAPPATIPNPIPAQFIDTRTGFEGGLSTSGAVGISSSFGANGGTVDADFEYSVSLSYPDQVLAGEFFSLNPASSLDSQDMTAFFPQLTGRITTSFETNITGFAKVCGIFNGGTGCTTTSDDWVDVDIDPEILEMNTPNLPQDSASLFGLDDLAFDATRIRVFADFGEQGLTLSLPGFPRPLLAINVGDVTLDAPSTDLGNSADYENGKLVLSSHLPNVVIQNVDLDARATAQLVLPPLGAVSNIGPLTFRGDVIDLGYGLTIDIGQDFELTPTLMVRLDFDLPVLVQNYEQPGIRAVTSITAPFGSLPDVALIDNQRVTVTPTFYMKADFKNQSEMIFNLSFFRDILNGSITMLGLELAADCISCEQDNLAEF